MRGGLRVWTVVLLGVLALGGCDRPPAVAPDGVDQVSGHDGEAPGHPVLGAVHRSRQTGGVHTESIAPPGATPARSIGTIDFRTRRSDTVVQILREDGEAVPYGRVVRTPEAVYAGMYLGREEPAWRRLGPDELAAAGPQGYHVDGLVLLDAVEAQHAQLPPDPGPGRGRTYRRPGAPPTGPDNVLGVVILAFTLDGKARVGSIDYTLPAIREHVFTMTFSGYGEAPPVEVPELDA